MKCKMVEQGFEMGSCLVQTPEGKMVRACEATLKEEGGTYLRLIESAHLSRPEHYFSIYQSGCNHSCKKCHSWEFSQRSSGRWYSTDEIAELVKRYEAKVTYREPREKATMWHATDLCRSCGRCILTGERSPLCPEILSPDQVVFGPQGWGPARNVVAFTGGDIACQAEFYAQATQKIKKKCKDMWVLLETNGYGLTPKNLGILANAGLDSFWLDIKAFHPDIYRKLCGTTNELVLRAPAEIVKRGFVLEVLTLFIPGWVESDQIEGIARLIFEVDEGIPFTILAFFPAYRLKDNPSPTLSQMLAGYSAAKKVGLKCVKLGNCGVFAKGEKDWRELIQVVGKECVG